MTKLTNRKKNTPAKAARKERRLIEREGREIKRLAKIAKAEKE